MQSTTIDTIQKHLHVADGTWNKYCLVFDRMAEYELQSGQSFDHPTPEFVIAFLDSLHSTSIHSAQANLQIVRLYLDAVGQSCAVQSLTAQQIDLTNGIIRKFIPSIGELYHRIQVVAQPIEGYCLYPALTFAWMGMSLKEAIALKAEQVDLESGYIRTNARLTYSVLNPEMRRVLKEYRNAQPQKLNNRQSVFPDREERAEFIFKMLSPTRSGRGTLIQSNYISKKIPEVREAYNKHHVIPMEVEYDDVIRSGRFAKLYEMECSGVDWNDPQNVLLMKFICDSERIEPSYLRHNYESYKKAFNLK